MALTVEETKDDYIAAKQAIGRTDAKILFVRRCKIGKQDKSDVKILAVTACRIYVVAKKQQPKIESSYHILDISSFDCSKPMNLIVTINVGDRQNQQAYNFSNQEDAEKTVSYMLALLKSNFIDVNVDKQVSLKTESKEKEVLVRNQAKLIVQSLSIEGQPCGSFALAYMCLCDLYNQTALAEVIWDINKIYASHSCKDFQVEDFDHLETKELIPLLAAVGYNTWFTRFVVSSYKLTNEMVDTVIRIIKRSPSIEDVTITDAHVNKEQVHRVSLALSANQNKTIKKINLSKNALEDRGVASLAGCFSTLQHGIESLNLSEVGLTSKGAGILASSLKNNKLIATSLVRLDLSGNVLKSEGAQSLCDFLTQPNAVESLNLSQTESALDLLLGALTRGCQQNMQELNLSSNPFSYRKAKEGQSVAVFQQFFTSSRSIKIVNLSNTKIPAPAVKAILIGLMKNPVLTDVGLDLSHNELKSAGSSEISSCLKDVRCLTKLNLADNGLDQDLEAICEAISSSQSIKELDLARNVSKSKYNNVVSEALSELVMSETVPLEKLSIADNKLRLDAAALFDCLGTNETLVSINISGNSIGDVGARLIAKALQINTKLREIQLDKNNITYKGLQDIALAMNRNFSLNSIPIPMADLTASLKHGGELFTRYYRQIEQALIRNQSSNDSTPDQAYKVHQGLLLSSIDNYTQFTDSLVVELQDLVNIYKNSSNEDVQKEVKTARTLIKEADQFRQVLAQLYSDPESSNKLFDDKFSKISQDVFDSIESVLKDNLDKMLEEAQSICPSALHNKESINSIRQELVDGGLLEKQVINNSLTQLSKNNLTHKLCESNLTTGNLLAERLRNVLVESLRNCINILRAEGEKAQTTEQSEPVREKESKKPEVEVKEDGETEKPDEKEKLNETEKPDETEKLGETEKQDENEKTEEREKLEETKEVDVDSKETEKKPEGKEESKKGEVDDTDSKADDETHLGESEVNISEPMTPSVTITSSPLLSPQMFDMPWELSAGKRISEMAADLSDDDDDADLAATKARTRLSTLASHPDMHKNRKKRVSVKRRPTFYREERDIDIDGPSPRTQSSSVSRKERSESFEIVDGPAPERTHLPSVGALDAISANASHLKVSKDRAKPQGRRAPTRVSKLAHMNPENAENYIETQAEISPKPSPKPTPKQRPVSAMPTSNVLPESHPPQRMASEKAKPEAPKKNEKEKKESKKSKKPIGGIQLPSLPGFLRKSRGSSKVEVTSTKAKAEAVSDVPDGKTKVQPVVKKNEPKPDPVVKEDAPKEVEANAALPSVDHQEAPSESEPQAKPEPVKRPPLVPKAGLPMAGGSALLAEMKKRQNKGEESKVSPAAKPKPPTAASKPEPPTAASKPEPPTAASKPERLGSMSKPPPPRRPASLRRPNKEGTPVVVDRPKPTQRPKPEGTATEKIAETKGSDESGVATELVRSGSASTEPKKTEDLEANKAEDSESKSIEESEIKTTEELEAKSTEGSEAKSIEESDATPVEASREVDDKKDDVAEADETSKDNSPVSNEANVEFI